jgi:hypothetical protein
MNRACINQINHLHVKNQHAISPTKAGQAIRRLKSNILRMKNVIILTSFFILIGLVACSQKQAPENVKKEFSQKYAGAKSVKWDSEKANEWEAEFKLNGKEMTANFDNSGKWLETETEVSAKELPGAVTSALNKDFSAYKTDEISIVENPEMKGFEVALKNKKDELIVIFGNDGTVLKKEAGGEKAEQESDEKGEKAGKESDEKDEKGGKEAAETREEKEAPAIVTKAFTEKFAGAIKVEWGSEEANEWEAEFTLNGKTMSACFDNAGKWTTTETVISEKELPAPVITALNTQFQGFGWNLIEIYEDTEMKGFEIGLKKGETAVEVIFDKDGKLLKKSDLKQEAEKEEKK